MLQPRNGQSRNVVYRYFLHARDEKTQKYIQVYRCKNTQSRNVLYIDSKIADICVDSQRANSDTPIKKFFKKQVPRSQIVLFSQRGDTHTHSHTKVKTEDTLSASLRVSGLFPSTYHQGSVQYCKSLIQYFLFLLSDIMFNHIVRILSWDLDWVRCI